MDAIKKKKILTKKATPNGSRNKDIHSAFEASSLTLITWDYTNNKKYNHNLVYCLSKSQIFASKLKSFPG